MQDEERTGAHGEPETRFRTELFGFDRVEVLTYIERISAANAEKARALSETIETLQSDLHTARGRSSMLEQKTNAMLSELESEKARAENAKAEADALRAEVRKANDAMAAVRSHLFACEQENATLKNDNSRLNETVEGLTRALAQRGASAEPAADVSEREYEPVSTRDKAHDILREANEKAEMQLKEARDESAALLAQADGQDKAVQGVQKSVDGIATSIAALQEQLAEVDARILEATGMLQRATERIAAALQAQDGAEKPAEKADAPAGTVSADEKQEEEPERMELPLETPIITQARVSETEVKSIYGKPHMPRAMPFAPFDSDMPYTPPYVEPGTAEAPPNAAPPPPSGEEAAPPPYVPHPTPVGPPSIFTKPEPNQTATALARIPQLQTAPLAASRPVIIPYSVPVPPVEKMSDADGTQEESWDRFARYLEAEGGRKKGSALSEDLLAHLNQLINGD